MVYSRWKHFKKLHEIEIYHGIFYSDDKKNILFAQTDSGPSLVTHVVHRAEFWFGRRDKIVLIRCDEPVEVAYLRRLSFDQSTLLACARF